MKTLFFTCWIPSKENPIKGVFIEEHRRSIINSGIPITSLSLNISSGEKIFNKIVEIREPNTPYENHVIHVQSRFYKWIYSIPYFSYRIAKNYIKKEFSPKNNFDLVHSNILFPCGIAGNSLAKDLKAKHLLTEHWSYVNHFLSHHLFKFQGIRTINRLDGLTVVSDFLGTKITPFMRSGISPVKIPNCIESSNFGCSKNYDSGVIRFVAIATWKSPKIPHLFIEALKLIATESNKNIELCLIGDGPLLNPFKGTTYTNLTIQFLGYKNKSDISQLLSESHFFVHASAIETFSVVIAEALSSGLPVVASNVGAVPELINQSNGILTENTIESWITAIQKVLENDYDRNQIKSEAIEKYNSTKVGLLFKKVYQDLY
jgi:glycosyltransferase involved in cell wall biosynthesis